MKKSSQNHNNTNRDLQKILLTKKLVTAEAIPKINTLIVIRNIEVDITA